jgi:acetyl esterase/lipase
MLRVRLAAILLLGALAWTDVTATQGRRGAPPPGRRGGAAPARGVADAGLPPGVTPYLNLAYVPNGHARQRLDLYVPDSPPGSLPVIVWIHGGGWAQGNKSDTPALPFTAKGFAVASIEYRLSQHARFPAQIEDCKTAVRWLRANASTYHLDPDRFAAWGSSAGGHLVALLGTSGDAKDLEGAGNLDQSSRVQAVVDWFGPTDLLKMGGSHDNEGSFESRLIGGPLQRNKDKAVRANPIAYITESTPPFLIMHGTNDRSVPFNQSELLASALKKAGIDETLIALPGARHGDPAFRSPGNMRKVEDFLTRHLKSTSK